MLWIFCQKYCLERWPSTWIKNIFMNEGWRCTHCTTCQSTKPHPRDTILLWKTGQHVTSRVTETTVATDVSLLLQFWRLSVDLVCYVFFFVCSFFNSASSLRFFLVYLGLGSVIFPFSEAQMSSRWWNLIRQRLLFQLEMMRRRQTPWSYRILTVLSFKRNYSANSTVYRSWLESGSETSRMCTKSRGPALRPGETIRWLTYSFMEKKKRHA